MTKGGAAVVTARISDPWFCAIAEAIKIIVSDSTARHPRMMADTDAHILGLPHDGINGQFLSEPATCTRAPPRHPAPTWIAIGTVETASALAMASQGHAFVEARFHSSERTAKTQREFERKSDRAHSIAASALQLHLDEAGTYR